MNNAGIGVYASFAETTEEDFARLMNIHVKGVFFLTQKLLPLINDGGRIRAVLYAVSQPDDVDVNEIIVRPTASA